jgi:NTE family protein
LNLLEQSGPQWDGSVTAFQRVSSKSSVFGGIRGSTDFERAGGSLRLFGFGGPFRLGSYGQNELFGSRGYLATAGYLREVGTLPSLFGDRIFLAGFGQYGDMFTGLQVPEQPMDLSGVLVARTVLGPVFFGGSWGNAGRQRWYFGVGRIF